MQDLVGLKFGRFTVVSFSHKDKNHAILWLCRCDCGAERVVFAGNLRRGNSKSCGCHLKEVVGDQFRTHGMSNTLIYKRWAKAKSRCENPKNPRFEHYGGRGIKVCERWQTFENFYEDMAPTYEEGLSLERNDVDKDYEPGNCSWIPRLDQAKNKQKKTIVETPWGPMKLADAARKSGISYYVLHGRMVSGRNRTIEEFFEAPKAKAPKRWIETPWGTLCLQDAAKQANLAVETFRERLEKWPKEHWFDPPGTRLQRRT